MIEGGLQTVNANDNKKEALLSIITVVYNGVDDFEETVLSVHAHRRHDMEYIVVDGGSTDGTIELLQKHNDKIDYWLSEPDNGIYDALNKAISKSRGNFFLVLNMGDSLLYLPHEELLKARDANADVVLFDVLLPGGDVFKSTVDFHLRFANTIHHQGAFYRRGLNIVYSLTYKVYSDFDTNQKLYIAKRKFICFEKVVSLHSLDGISAKKKHMAEYYSVMRDNFGIMWAIAGFLHIKKGKWTAGLNRLIR